MRIAFIVILVIHGLIHLLGFVKAFGLANVKQLTQTISKPFGGLWLLACILFVVTALMYLSKNGYWWLPGFIAVLISQILIILYWQDAKFGTIANVIILAVSIIGFANWSYFNKYQNDVRTSLEKTGLSRQAILTETDLEHLPEPVKKYLRYCGAVGKPKVSHFNIKFTGKIRKDEQSEWMPFTSEQYNFMDNPARLFFMKATMKGLPVAGYHAFMNGRAYMDIRLMSLYKVQYQDGAEMDISETVTFFNDMCCMAPPTLIDKRIKWLETDQNNVKASFTNNDITITAWLYFNDTGELINFISEDRYAADVNKQLTWATPLKDYHEIKGYTLAGNAEAIYTYPYGDLCYGMFKLVDVEYN